MEEGDRLKSKKYKTPLSIFDAARKQKLDDEVIEIKIENSGNDDEKKKESDKDFLFPISSLF